MSKNMLIVTAFFFLVFVVILRFGSTAMLARSDVLVTALVKGQDLGSALKDTVAMSDLNPDTWVFSDIMEGVNTWLHSFVDIMFPAFLSMLDSSVMFIVTALGVESKVLAGSLSYGPLFRLTV